MAERKRSKQERSDTADIMKDAADIDQANTAGGREAHELGSVEDRKKAREAPAGRTRRTKTNELKDTERGGGDA